MQEGTEHAINFAGVGVKNYAVRINFEDKSGSDDLVRLIYELAHNKPCDIDRIREKLNDIKIDMTNNVQKARLKICL